MRVFDAHLHLEPAEMLRPASRQLFEKTRGDYERVQAFVQDPAAFVKYLDEQAVERVAVINYVNPEVLGTGPEINDFAASYCAYAPSRLLAFGGIEPRLCDDVEAEFHRIVKLGIRGIKLHPPHQGFAANAYREGLEPLATLYRLCQQEGLPVMVHTGTSIFPGARNVYADPLPCDDVAVDFPDLKLIVAHGGRPIWMTTAFFLVRRHPNAWLDLSSIPPQSLLDYFPKLETIGGKLLFGSDWPGPGVPDIGANVERFNQLPLPEDVRRKALYDNAARLFDQ